MRILYSDMILFLGDSITEWWDRDIFNRDYSQFYPVVLAKAGYTTRDLLYLIEDGRIDNINPKMVVMLIGTNNSTIGDTAMNVANDIKKIIDMLFQRFADTRVLLRGILPRGDNLLLNLRNMEVNKIISGFSSDPRITYVEHGSEFLDSNGNILHDLMPDALHLSWQGYEVLSKVLTPVIKILLK